MNTIASIVAKTREAYGQNVELKYIHPTLYIVCVDSVFEGKDEEQRYKEFSKQTSLDWSILSQSSIVASLSVLLLTESERKNELDFLDSAAGHHWLPLLDKKYLDIREQVEVKLPHAVHFYGYKGGQARSTVLAMLARQLADDGYKILAVDADIEAPSLDVIFDSAASNTMQTLLGAAAGDQLSSISVYVPNEEGGKVDLIACRPRDPHYDMDFAALSLRTALDVSLLERTVNKIRIENDDYDYIFYDHRSGLSNSVLPIVMAHKGPVVICLRIDEQSRDCDSLIEVLLGQLREIPGAYVSFSLDPEDNREKMLNRHSEVIANLLDKIGVALKRGATNSDEGNDDFSPEELSRFWVPWFHDRKFLETRFPSLSEINESNRSALLQLREVLGINSKKLYKNNTDLNSPESGSIALSPSGSNDEGFFIETPELARLFTQNTSITYILGRKGTGKTRLLKELHKRKLGEPLVVAADSQGAGLSTADSMFIDLANNFTDEPENLWWCILGAALQSSSTADPIFKDNLKDWERRYAQSPSSFRVSDIASIASNINSKRVFLIDGIETAFRSAKLIQHVEALFKFLLTVQSDPKLNTHVQVRLFLRTDLARRAIQNVEQQTSGRRLDLTWSTRSIFNFVLSRIAQLDWFKEQFPNTVQKINNLDKSLKAGLVEPVIYEALLLEIFPAHMRRNNLQTLTFLKTYFSDAAGDDENRAAFYPRLFDAFLSFLAYPDNNHVNSQLKRIENGLINQVLVLIAHEQASRSFLDEVKQELTVLLDLDDDLAENERQVTQLLAAFEGLSTPFQVEDCIVKVSHILDPKDQSKIRTSLLRMKEIGMFEDRPGYVGAWRAGRLFKSALRMKYMRTPKR